MTSYSSSQLTALQGYISAAQNALTSYNAALAANNTSLATNDAANVVSALTSYYGAQTSIRGYATDALNVINNTGLFGAVANQVITHGLFLSAVLATCAWVKPGRLR